MMIRERYLAASTFEQFLETTVENRELWHHTARRAQVPPELVARVEAVPGRWRLLALVEDWCGDGMSTIPYVARLAELARNLELRVLTRDANPDLMDAHLSDGARAIPVVMLFDDAMEERAWWGSRPAELQRWVAGPGQLLGKEDRYREVRAWHARDRGRSALEEITRMIEEAAPVPAPAA